MVSSRTRINNCCDIKLKLEMCDKIVSMKRCRLALYSITVNKRNVFKRYGFGCTKPNHTFLFFPIFW